MIKTSIKGDKNGLAVPAKLPAFLSDIQYIINSISIGPLKYTKTAKVSFYPVFWVHLR